MARCSGLSLAAIVMFWWGGMNPAIGQSVFPARLDAYLTKVLKLSAEERNLLLSGAPLAKNLEADASKEVAMFGAIWIKAPTEKYLAALQDIEYFESGGGFRVTKKISEPPRIQDFADLVLPESP